VVDLARSEKIGDVGVAWPWGDEKRHGEAGFVRHNVVVWMSGSWEALYEVARAVDGALAPRKTGVVGAASSESLFPAFDSEKPRQVAPGGRLDLGAAARPQARHFFIAEGGSVNRDPARPDDWYFRAGLAKGAYAIKAYRVEQGLLPAQQTLRINID
jgi:hypothetical protein